MRYTAFCSLVTQDRALSTRTDFFLSRLKLRIAQIGGKWWGEAPPPHSFGHSFYKNSD
jgi:hypothetical protein